MNERRDFETFLINSTPNRWYANKLHQSPINSNENILYYVPPSIDFSKIKEITTLRTTFTTLEVSNLLKILPPIINNQKIRISDPTPANQFYKTFSVMFGNRTLLKIQSILHTEMYTIRCLRPYLLKWSEQRVHASLLTVDPKQAVYEILMDPKKESLLREKLGPNHPYCIFGHHGFKQCKDICIKNHFDSTAYSKSGAYYHKNSELKKTLTEVDIQMFPGLFKINYIEDNNYPLLYNGKNVHSLVFIDYRSNKVINETSFIELDCSFFAIEPYVYCIPMGIIQNESIPLGLSVGPSESLEIYEQFYDLFIKNYPNVKIEAIPLLSDEGKPLKSLAIKHEIIHFFCYRHLINKFGASTELGNIVRELLYSFSEEEFNEKVKNYEKHLKKILNPNSPHLKQFQNLFNICLYPEVPIHKYPQQGIWYRSKYKVATCSNHIESCHQKLNYKVMMETKNVNEHLLCLLQYITEKYETVKKSRNAHDAIRTLEKIKQDIDVGECNRHCCSIREFYSSLYGFSFPCVHTLDDFDESEISAIPEFRAEKFFQIIEENVRYENWKFPSDKTHLKINLGIDEIQWLDNNKPSWKALSPFKIIFKDYISKKNEVKRFIIDSFVHFSYNVYGAYQYEDKFMEVYDQYLRKLIDNKKPDEFMMTCKVQSQKLGTWKLPKRIKPGDNKIIFETESHPNELLKKEIIDIIVSGASEKLDKPIVNLDNDESDYQIAQTKPILTQISINEEDDYDITSYITGKSFVGLKNLGATCFLNSLLQILYNLPVLRLNVYTCASNTDLIRELQSLFYSLDFSKHAVSPQKLTKTFRFSTNEQQDYQEFSNFFLELLKKPIDAIKFLFHGRIRSIIKCTNIDYSSVKYDDLIDISLDISQFSTLESSMEQFLQKNTLTGDDKYDCGPEHGKQDAEIQIEIVDLPRVLTFHLQRFKYNVETGKTVKNNSDFEFRKNINMYPFVSKESYHSSEDSTEYELFGVVTHTGTAEFGHYYAFIRPFICFGNIKEKWFKFNDSIVEESNNEEAINGNFGGSQKAYSANILYYIRKDSINDIIYNPLKRILAFDAKIIPHSIKDSCTEIINPHAVQHESHSFYHTFKLVSTESLLESAGRGIMSWHFPKTSIVCERKPTFDNLLDLVSEKTGVDKDNVRIFGIKHPNCLGSEITKYSTIESMLKYDALFVPSINELPKTFSGILVPLFLYIPDIKDPLRFLWIEKKNIDETISSLFQRVYDTCGKGKLQAYIARCSIEAELVVNPLKSFKENHVENGSIFVLEYSEFDDERHAIPNVVSIDRVNTFSEIDKCRYRYFTEYMKIFPSSFAEFLSFRQLSECLRIRMTTGICDKVYIPKNIKFQEFMNFVAVAFNIQYNSFSDSMLLYANDSKVPITVASRNSTVIDALSQMRFTGEIVPIVMPSSPQDSFMQTLRMIITITKRENIVTDKFSFIVPIEWTCADIIANGITKGWFPDNSITRVVTQTQNLILESHSMEQKLEDIPNPIRIDILGDYMKIVSDFDEEISVVFCEEEFGSGLFHNIYNPFLFHIYSLETVCNIKKRIIEYISGENEFKKRTCKSLLLYHPGSREYLALKDEDVLCHIMDVKTEFLCIECP